MKARIQLLLVVPALRLLVVLLPVLVFVLFPDTSLPFSMSGCGGFSPSVVRSRRLTTSSTSSSFTSSRWTFPVVSHYYSKDSVTRTTTRLFHNARTPTTTEDDADENHTPHDDNGATTSSPGVDTVAMDRSINNKLDNILSQLTCGFPIFVLFSAILGTYKPNTLLWVNQGKLISVMLASVMCGTGLTLQKKDFQTISYQAVILGVLCQFLIMPFSAWSIGQLVLRQGTKEASALFLGLCLVGSSPGGTASNLVALIAQADVALSVVLTTCSTLLAVGVTPWLVKLLVGGASSAVQVSAVTLIEATARVVLLPVLFGMFLQQKLPKAFSRFLARFTPFASVLLVSLICGGVVSENSSLLRQGGVVGPLSVVLMGSVTMLHSLGFFLGYFVPKLIFQQDRKTARTISIEVGMQNSALAVVLARSMVDSHPLASLPGALSATVHSCIGSLLAAIWRIQQRRDRGNEEE